jgi:hypothetical protein
MLVESGTEGDRRCRMGAALPLSANRAASGHVHYSSQETGNNSRMTANTSNSALLGEFEPHRIANMAPITGSRFPDVDTCPRRQPISALLTKPR